MRVAVVLFFLGLLATNINFCRGRSGRRHLGNTPVASEYEDYEGSKLDGIKKLPWKSLEYLDLRSNLLEGPVPVPPPNLKVFSISNNKFTGAIPQFICNTRNVEVVDLSNNSLSGTIPDCIGNISNTLRVLDLRKNRFHGTIPNTFIKDNQLKTLNLNGNELTGTVPRSLLNCTKLEVLDLGNNKIIDTFPYWLGSLPELQVLVLRSNKFYSFLKEHEADYSFSKLRIFDLSNNNFSGSFPAMYFENMEAMMNIGEASDTESRYMGGRYYEDSVTLTIKRFEVKLEKILTIFTTIDFSNNSLRGEIPELIGKLHSLHLLNLSQNNLAGSIPSSLGNLTNLESLDLSSNKLDGEIPRQLTSLTFLACLNVSQNKLIGRIPQGNQFPTFTSDSYSGNLGLCGFPLSNNGTAGEPTQPLSAPDDNTDCEDGFGWRVVLMGYGCGMVVGITGGYIVISNRKPRWFVRMLEGGQHRKKRHNKKRKGRRIFSAYASTSLR